MECWTIENFTPLATITAAFIGGGWLMFVHWLNMKRSAKAEFISSVFTILEGVYPKRINFDDDIAVILKRGHAGMQKAVFIYRFSVGKHKLREYCQAWEQYSSYYMSVTDRSITDHNVYADISAESGNPVNESDPYDKLCVHIDKLLSFAE